MQEPKEPLSENERTNDVATGMAFTISGIAFAGVGLEGIDNNEAKTPSDALGSIYLGKSEVFITTPDLGFGAVMGVGLALSVAGLYKILHRSR